MNEKILPPAEDDQQWLKDLLDSVAEFDQPATSAEPTTTPEDEQWLKDLFASAEKAAEQEFAPEEPEEEPLIQNIDLPQWSDTSEANSLPAGEEEPAVPSPWPWEAVDLSAFEPEQAAEVQPVSSEDVSAEPAEEAPQTQWPWEAVVLPIFDADIAGTEASAAEEPTAEQSPDENPEDSSQWFGFDSPLSVPEIGADEQAADAAGLVRLEGSPEPGTEESTEPDTVTDRQASSAVSDQEDADESDDEEDDDDPSGERNPSKRRPKRKDSYGLLSIPHMFATVIWLAIIVTFGVFLGQWLWQGASDVLAFGREERMVTITVNENDDLDDLVEKLHAAGLINEPLWFRLYGQLTDAMDDIAPGTFELSTLFDYHALVAHMSTYSVARVTVKVVIPEGYSCDQIFSLLEAKGVCSVADLETASVSGDLNNYWFLEGVARDSKYCLEGYLFPDTYEFYVGDNATRVLNKLLSNFDNRFTDIMSEKLDTLNETLADMMRANGMSEDYIAQHRFTIREVVIIASMIEKETSGAAEGYTISSVIYNRLTNPTNFPYLNVDATLVYATGNTTITEEDKLLDSPYNTYLYPGLIPGPICNPSRVSLDAALDPSVTDYYFYALNPETNQHHFSKTYKEHQTFLDSLPKEEPETP